jgi:hypothetical protein
MATASSATKVLQWRQQLPVALAYLPEKLVDDVEMKREKRVRLPGLASTPTRSIPPRPGSGIFSDMEASHTSNAEEIRTRVHGGACS